MSETGNPKSAAAKYLLGGIFALAFLVLMGYSVYMWVFCRFFVPPGYMAVVTAKGGDLPPAGAILVERGQKGIWREVLGEGRHFLDPIQYEWKIIPAVNIPLGKLGIVTAKVGKELPPGEIIAPDHHSKGIWRDVLGPGVYRLNPEGYVIEIVDAISIPVGFAGVVTSQTGTAPQPGNFAKAGEKGVLHDILQPGLYYLNRYAYQVNVIEIGMNQVTMSSQTKGESVISSRNYNTNTNAALQELEANTLQFQNELRQRKVMEKLNNSAPHPAAVSKPVRGAKAKSAMAGKSFAAYDLEADRSLAQQALASPESKAKLDSAIFGESRAVEFPSRDGFKVSLDMTVEFELKPAQMATIYLLYGDLPQVVEKIILPQVLSSSRLKGSSYGAQEFIMGDGREKFQSDLQRELVRELAGKNIVVHNAIIRGVEIPKEILAPIQSISLAREQNLTNISLQETAQKLGELNTETELIEQRRLEVEQETTKLVATIAAETKRSAETIAAETELKVAQIALQRSELLAKTAQLRGETEVKAKYLVNSAAAEGDQLRAKSLGNGELLADWALVDALNPKVETRIIYAGPGTLWTDLRQAGINLPTAK